MRDRHQFNSPRVSTPPNAFDPELLEKARALEEPLTAAEADFAGPWKAEPLDGHPGCVALLRVWESQAKGDVPFVVFRHAETAALCAALLPVLGREPLFHLADEPASEAPLPGGYPLVAVYGEQGPQVSGWIQRYHPEVAAGLHLLEALVRSPYQLSGVLQALGGGALAQIGRILAEWLSVGAEPAEAVDEAEV
jgi:hypothetical protein